MRARRSELTRRGVLLPYGRRAGRAEGNGKLTVLQADEIAASTESTCVLVARYGVSATTVRNIAAQFGNGCSAATLKDWMAGVKHLPDSMWQASCTPVLGETHVQMWMGQLLSAFGACAAGVRKV